MLERVDKVVVRPAVNVEARVAGGTELLQVTTPLLLRIYSLSQDHLTDLVANFHNVTCLERPDAIRSSIAFRPTLDNPRPSRCPVRAHPPSVIRPISYSNLWPIGKSIIPPISTGAIAAKMEIVGIKD